MTKLKKINTTETFDGLLDSGRSMKENNDCAVRAVAAACDKPYAEVREYMNSNGRKHGKDTAIALTYRAVKFFGYKTVKVEIQDIINKFPRPHCDVLKNFTSHHPRRFPGCLDENKVYLIWFSGHIAAFKGGELHDWAINRSLRAQFIDEVVKDDASAPMTILT